MKSRCSVCGRKGRRLFKYTRKYLRRMNIDLPPNGNALARICRDCKIKYNLVKGNLNKVW